VEVSWWSAKYHTLPTCHTTAATLELGFIMIVVSFRFFSRIQGSKRYTFSQKNYYRDNRHCEKIDIFLAIITKIVFAKNLQNVTKITEVFAKIISIRQIFAKRCPVWIDIQPV
jgi:dipeptide/tripeptide permease